MNPAYQLPEIDYCIDKVGVKAVIAPESFRKQNYHEMFAQLLAKKSESKTLKSLIIHSDKKLP